MDDQITPGDQIGDQIFASVCIYLRGPDICPKGSSSSNLVAQEPSGLHLVAHLVAHQVAQEPSGLPSGRRSIWSPIRSPERLVVNLVVVNAFSFSIL